MKVKDMGQIGIPIVRAGLFAAIGEQIVRFKADIFTGESGEFLYATMRQRIVNGESISDVLTTSLMDKGFTEDMLTEALAIGFVKAKLRFPEVSDMEVLLQDAAIVVR